MNTKQFIVLFFGLALLASAKAILFGTGAGTAAGAGIVANNGFLTIPLVSAASGTLATPLAVLGVLKLAAAAAIGLGLLGGELLGERRDTHLRQKRNAVESDPEAVFALISAMDSHGCGKQLICELEAKNPASLLDDEKLMLSLFSSKSKLKNSPKSEYDNAAMLGFASKNQIMCRHRYVNCPYTSNEMMTALRNAHL